MPFSNPFDREARAARDLANQVPFEDCVGGTYGEEDDDYSDNEHARSWEQTDVDSTDRQYIIYNKEAIDELDG